MQISKGHEGGFIGLRRVLEFCLRLNVRCVSIYAFSIENFSRSQDEVSSLMDLASTKLDEICQHGDLIEQHNVRISVLGAKQLLNDEVRSKLEMIEKRTAGNDGAILNICMPYTSRDEMSSAMQVSGSDKKVYQKNLMTANSPPLDILIRTSGVNRFSDYLMWQASHQNTFIQVVDAFWPDIGISELIYMNIFIPVISFCHFVIRDSPFNRNDKMLRSTIRSTHRITQLRTLSTEQQKPRKVSTSAWVIGGAISAFLGGYASGSMAPPTILTLLYPRPSPPAPPSHTPEGAAFTSNLESQLQELKHVKELRNDNEYYESRPYANLPDERRVNSLTAGALRAPGRLTLPPIVFSKWDESEAIITLHVGRGLCGHDGITHGGLIATLFDESLARTAILSLPNKIGVTANLKVNYRAPLKADQFVVIKSTLKKLDGRKAFVQASITDLEGKLYADADSLFIEPKYAYLLKNSGVTQAIGGKPEKFSNEERF
ncbi:Thioesterase/thiol ester dehydrase-isomerase [Wallemia mellicola]|nr:Thioesterase/thiol ester dehydrase-isomerase [Wallemia mellicola]TIB92646.1 Thioesterase/thiol ester dehydrase-isomerase [Wallemia mellicola]TIC44462.1 Thioesterase/thiol ester dehydrase-isomerase [Wallemia mellicola]TIC53703.1 Thioesterase/thiol ester dehydrase-isomerase [Wallemia mellicola]